MRVPTTTSAPAVLGILALAALGCSSSAEAPGASEDAASDGTLQDDGVDLGTADVRGDGASLDSSLDAGPEVGADASPDVADGGSADVLDAASSKRGFPSGAPWVSFYGTSVEMKDLAKAASTFRILNIDVD